MSIKKCVNGSFVNDVYREYGTGTDTITTLPKTIIGDGQPISAYTIKGNMSQSGTPTPSNPIYPTEVGDKTANLLNNTLTDIEDSGIRITVNADKTIIVNGSLTSGTNKSFVLDTLSFKSGKTYTISGVTGYTSSTLQLWTASTAAFPSGNRLQSYNGAVTRTALADEECILRLFVYSGVTFDNVKIYPMIIEGSDTSAPYEPYGYKIPILSNGVSYPIYLSEPIRKIGDSVDTAPSSGTASRVIKKLVLTGQEIWNTSGNIYYTNVTDGYNQHDVPFNLALCTHFDIRWDAAEYSGTFNLGGLTQNVSSKWNGNIVFNKSGYATLQDFQDFLATQYSNGTPVTLYYVRRTAQTESFTAPTLPTSGSQQTFDVDTTLKPSEVSLTYHGWHEHEDTKYTTP